LQIGSTKLDAEGRVHPLAKLADDIEADEGEWRTYYELEAPEESPLPMVGQGTGIVLYGGTAASALHFARGSVLSKVLW
jgi:hypothetical protein